jgi:GNAT superfamily N-acetyltransferase
VTLETVRYSPARRDALNRMMDAVWGSHMPDEEFEWWFERNPVGPQLISLAEDDGKVVGVAAMSFFRLRLDGREQVVAMPVHVATDPGYRGRGIFPRLELANEQAAGEAGSPITLTFPNAASHPIFVGRLGWQDLPGRRVWARLLRPGAVPRYFRGKASPPGGLRRPDSKPRTVGGFRIEPLAEFGPEADALWQAAAPGYGSHLVRDAAYLNWRFAAAPREYRAFGAFADRRLAGIAIVGYAYRHGVAGGFLADLIAPPDGRRVTKALLRRSLAEVRGGAEAGAHDRQGAAPRGPPRSAAARLALHFRRLRLLLRFASRIP